MYVRVKRKRQTIFLHCESRVVWCVMGEGHERPRVSGVRQRAVEPYRKGSSTWLRTRFGAIQNWATFYFHHPLC